MVGQVTELYTGEVEQPVDNGHVPVEEPCEQLVELSAADLRHLSPSAQALTRVLIREKDRQKPEDGWFLSDLSELARRARITYATAKAALAELRRAGLVACERHVVRRKIWVESDGVARYETVNANERNWYAIVGRVRRRCGVQRLELSANAWRNFLDALKRSRKQIVRIAARRPAWPEQIEWQPSWVAEMMGHLDTPSASDLLGLSTKSSTSVFSFYNRKTKEASEKARTRISSSDGDEPKRGELDVSVAWLLAPDLDPSDPAYDPAAGSGFLAVGNGQRSDPRSDPLYTGPMVPPYIVPDRNRREPCTIAWLSPEMVPEQLATYVVDAYRRAVKKIYGVDWFHYFKGDIKKAKGYDKLLASGKAFAEHSIAPEHWAIWRLTWFSTHVKAFAHKPPPVWMIMGAKKVSEKAGWFRKDYDLPLPVFKLDPMINEQHLRNQEASNRWRNVTNPLLYLPRPYVEKRRLEIARGFEDPHDNWPRRSYWRGDE